MKISLKFAFITMLAVSETVLIIVSDNWSPLWYALGFAIVGAIATEQARAASRVSVTCVPITRSRKIECCVVWALCACGIVYGIIFVKRTREAGDFRWPHTLVVQMEIRKILDHHYPATRAEVVPLDGSHKLVSYHSDGQRYDFTIGIGYFFPRLWAYNSETQKWTRERD